MFLSVLPTQLAFPKVCYFSLKFLATHYFYEWSLSNNFSGIWSVYKDLLRGLARSCKQESVYILTCILHITFPPGGGSVLQCTISLGNLEYSNKHWICCRSVSGTSVRSVQNMYRSDLLSDLCMFCRINKPGLGRAASLQSTVVI